MVVSVSSSVLYPKLVHEHAGVPRCKTDWKTALLCSVQVPEGAPKPDVILAHFTLDVSGSMNSPRDNKPIDAAKDALIDVLGMLKSRKDVRVRISTFGGKFTLIDPKGSDEAEVLYAQVDVEFIERIKCSVLEIEACEGSTNLEKAAVQSATVAPTAGAWRHVLEGATGSRPVDAEVDAAVAGCGPAKTADRSQRAKNGFLTRGQPSMASRGSRVPALMAAAASRRW